MTESQTVYYFAFGSNLKAKRMHICNPTAVLVCAAKLLNHELVFLGNDSKLWKGAPASVVPVKGSVVWGAVWSLHQSEVKNLDEQEAVHLGIYNRTDVNVITADGENIQCITYQKADSLIPHLPSPHYMRVIIEGAQEVGLPQEYIDKLQTVKHNELRGEICLTSDFVINI
jgi:gamma-glutamylcyclotransferase